MPNRASRRALDIARQYYLEGLSKVEIGKLHDLSRFKVARILEDSLASGLVKIEIADPEEDDVELADALRRRFQLKQAVVVPSSAGSDEALRAALGRAAAGLLHGMVTSEDVLGIAWGRTLSAMAAQVEDLPPCKIVQLTGIAGSAQANSADLVRQLLSASRGAHFPLYAPLLVSDPQTAAALARQPSIKATISRWHDVTVAMVAVGSWDASGSQLHPVLDPADHRAIAPHRVAAEMCAMLFAEDGTPLKTSLTRRTMGIPYADLMRVPEVVAVAGGLAKAAALRSVLRGRAVTSVVTDAEVAQQLLDGEATLVPRTIKRRSRRSAAAAI